MFDSQILDIQELRSVLTDAGHTAVGFAAMAAKKANDVRLDLTDRYEDSFDGLRSQALVAVKRVETVRADMEARVEPVIAKMIDRLPEPAQKVVNDTTEAAKDLQARSYEFVVKALTVTQPTKAAATKAAAPKAATPKAATPKAAPKKSVAKKAVAKKAPVKPVAAKTTAKAAVTKAPVKKAPVTKAAVKKAAVKKAPVSR
jgi:hypothetical protein